MLFFLTANSNNHLFHDFLSIRQYTQIHSLLSCCCSLNQAIASVCPLRPRVPHALAIFLSNVYFCLAQWSLRLKPDNCFFVICVLDLLAPDLQKLFAYANISESQSVSADKLINCPINMNPRSTQWQQLWCKVIYTNIQVCFRVSEPVTVFFVSDKRWLFF